MLQPQSSKRSRYFPMLLIHNLILRLEEFDSLPNSSVFLFCSEHRKQNSISPNDTHVQTTKILSRDVQEAGKKQVVTRLHLPSCIAYAGPNRSKPSPSCLV